MVERIEGFATPQEWNRAYREINEFEAELSIRALWWSMMATLGQKRS